MHGGVASYVVGDMVASDVLRGVDDVVSGCLGGYVDGVMVKGVLMTD